MNPGNKLIYHLPRPIAVQAPPGYSILIESSTWDRSPIDTEQEIIYDLEEYIKTLPLDKRGSDGAERGPTEVYGGTEGYGYGRLGWADQNGIIPLNPKRFDGSDWGDKFYVRIWSKNEIQKSTNKLEAWRLRTKDDIGKKGKGDPRRESSESSPWKGTKKKPILEWTYGREKDSDPLPDVPDDWNTSAGVVLPHVSETFVSGGGPKPSESGVGSNSTEMFVSFK
jgi:hypothetical protein